MEVLSDQELSCDTGRRHPGGQIDRGADIVALAVEHSAMVCADVQSRKLGLGFDDTVDSQAELDGVPGLSEHQHERIADLLENPAAVPGCAAAHRAAKPAQHI